MNEVKAYAKNIKGSPRKARIVADAVRGKKALYAIESLNYMQKGAALKIRKVVESAVANAVHNFNVQPEELIVTRIMVDSGNVLKRMHPQSRGRGRTILKRSSNITVYVGTKTAMTQVVADKKAKEVESEVVAAEVETPKAKVTKSKTSKELKSSKLTTTAKKASTKAKKATAK